VGLRIKEQLEMAGFEKEIQGHDIMDLMRFDEDTKHMIIFDVIKAWCRKNPPLRNERWEKTEQIIYLS